jgi:hypothetical protein
MLARSRDALGRALRPGGAAVAAAAAASLAGTRWDWTRAFGRHPKNDPRVIDAEKPVPR